MSAYQPSLDVKEEDLVLGVHTAGIKMQQRHSIMAEEGEPPHSDPEWDQTDTHVDRAIVEDCNRHLERMNLEYKSVPVSMRGGSIMLSQDGDEKAA